MEIKTGIFGGQSLGGHFHGQASVFNGLYEFIGWPVLPLSAHGTMKVSTHARQPPTHGSMRAKQQALEHFLSSFRKDPLRVFSWHSEEEVGTGCSEFVVRCPPSGEILPP